MSPWGDIFTLQLRGDKIIELRQSAPGCFPLAAPCDMFVGSYERCSVAVRTCPTCVTVLSPALVVAYSDNLECPGCKSHLTVWDGSRLLASIAGILAGVLVWQLTTSATEGALAWTLPVLYSFVGFGAVSAFVLMWSAELRLKPEEPVALPAVASSAQVGGGGHH